MPTVKIADKPTLDTVNTNTSATKTTCDSINTTLGTVNTNVNYIKNNLPTGGGAEYRYTYTSLANGTTYYGEGIVIPLIYAGVGSYGSYAGIFNISGPNIWVDGTKVLSSPTSSSSSGLEGVLYCGPIHFYTSIKISGGSAIVQSIATLRT